MKEAAGEANMTVITIVLIGIIAAIAIPLITNLMESSKRSSCCQNAGGEMVGTSCDPLGSMDESTVKKNYDTCMGEEEA